MKSRNVFRLLTVFFLLFSFAIIPCVFAQTQVLKSLEDDISYLVESIKPSLVTVQTKNIAPLPSRKNRVTKVLPSGPVFIGSGIVYDKEGHILTTVGVVGRREKFAVILPDGKEVEGKLVGVDPEYNLAVLKVKASGLIPAKLGDSDKLKSGSWLTIVGNSYGLPSAVALGVMNGKREDGFMQMSANVSPGNSGGPILNTRGEVVGLVSAKMTEPSYINSVEIFKSATGGVSVSPSQLDLPTSGVSLAIPVNDIKQKANYIIKYGTIKKGYLGVYLGDLDENQLKEYKLESGVIVNQVAQDTPADQAGLQDGDIIVLYNGKKVENSEQLSKLIKQTRPETQITLQILRDNAKKDIKVTMGEDTSRYANLYGSFDLEPDLFQNMDEAFDNPMWQEMQKGYRQRIEKANPKLEQSIHKLQQQLEELKQRLDKLEK